MLFRTALKHRWSAGHQCGCRLTFMSQASALWLFLTTYALLYGTFGMQSPFVPTLLRERGLQAQDIGLVLAAAMVVRVLAGRAREELERMIAREARWHVGRAGERGVRASSLALLAAEIVEADGAHPLDGGMCAQLELDGLYRGGQGTTC